MWQFTLILTCSSWRKGARKAWRLPCNTHNDLLPALCGSRAIRDELCCRSLSFISACLYSDNEIVSTVARYGVEFGRMFSPVGRNIAFCNMKYGSSAYSLVHCRSALTSFKRQLTVCTNESVSQAAFLLELLMIRSSLLHVPMLDQEDLQTIINNVCVS